MLSYQGIGAPQAGQADPGYTRLRPSGSRAITTFKKLPMTKPATRKRPITPVRALRLQKWSRRPDIPIAGMLHDFELSAYQGQVATLTGVPLESTVTPSPEPHTLNWPLA